MILPFTLLFSRYLNLQNYHSDRTMRESPPCYKISYTKELRSGSTNSNL